MHIFDGHGAKMYLFTMSTCFFGSPGLGHADCNREVISLERGIWPVPAVLLEEAAANDIMQYAPGHASLAHLQSCC